MSTPAPAPSDAILRAILNSPEDIVIFALDTRYRYLAFNDNHRDTMRAIWGADIAVGQSMLHYIGRPDDRDKAKANFDRVLAGEAFKVIEAYGDEALGRRYYQDVYSPIVDGSGTVRGLTLYLTDITEQRRTERELEQYRRGLEALVAERTQELEEAHAHLLHAQKLESLGVMAGGIAHDFNNLLSGILVTADLAMEHLTAGPARERVTEITRIASRAAQLTQQLLAYTGQAHVEVGPVDLNEVVLESQELLRATAGGGVSLVFDLESGVSNVEGDATQLQQVLLNLVLNAAESMGDEAGTVRVSTTEAQVDENALQRAWLGEDCAPGPYVILRVEDDGGGMDEATAQRLFDPFFTTKFAGRGLGLASVLGIVRTHEGAIRVRSAPDQGSVFDVMLPVLESSQSPPRYLDPSPSVGAQSGTVLVVDDEPGVRETTAEVVRALGYAALEAVDGEQGLAMVERRGNLVAVVLDLTMPRLGGEATLARLRKVRPELPVLMMSGWSRDHARLRFLADTPHTGFLQKPFRLAALREALRELMGGSNDR